MFWFLLVAHIIGDGAFQPSFVAHNKDKLFILMLWHSITVTGMISIPLFLMDKLNLYVIFFLVITHILIDSWKSRQPKDDEHLWCTTLDQVAHVLCIVIVAIFMDVPFMI